MEVLYHVAKKITTPKKDERTRNWTFFVYPDSAPENWRSVIDELHIQWVESPLHDADMNGDGESKKPHWHILVMFEGMKSYEQIKEITDSLNSPIPQKCQSARGLVRYMAHLDSPDKAQYNTSDIISHGGVDVAELLKPTSSCRYQLIAEMRAWVMDSECTEFSDLFNYSAVERFEDWFPLLCDNSAYIMGEFIKSRRNKKKGEAEKAERQKDISRIEQENNERLRMVEDFKAREKGIDPETGEIKNEVRY